MVHTTHSFLILYPMARLGEPFARAMASPVLHLPKGVARLSFTVRIGRALSYRARSASKKDVLAASFPSFHLLPTVQR